MSRIADRVVNFAAALLPARVRDRYREQWLGELRDAPELALRPSEIALGSLAFAATFARTMPAGSRATGETVARRARLSLALSTSAAVLAISQYASAPIEAQTGPDPYGFAVGAVWAILTLYVVIAPLAAILAVLTTRGMSWGLRAAVVLISASCALPLTSNVLTDSISADSYGRVYLTFGLLAVPMTAAFTVLIAVTVQQRRRNPDAAAPHERLSIRLRRSAVAGVVVALSVAIGFIAASGLWAARALLAFDLPNEKTNHAQYEQWLTLKAAAEQMVSTTLSLWIALGLAIACGIILSGLSARSTARLTAALTVGALSIVLLSFGSLDTLFQLVLPSISAGFPVDLVTEVAQIALLVLILSMVTRRRRPRAEPPAALEPLTSAPR